MRLWAFIQEQTNKMRAYTPTNNELQEQIDLLKDRWGALELLYSELKERLDQIQSHTKQQQTKREK